jgi:hypothetical protein
MSEEKPSNPKDSIGIKKTPLSTVSSPFIAGVGLAMMEGALKYGRHNYRTVGVRSSVYYDALMRHMMAWWEGQDIDPDSGLSHLLKAAACLAVVFDSMHRGNLNDDRPPRVSDDWLIAYNNLAHALVEKYPDAKPAHTEQAHTVIVDRNLDKELFHEDEYPTHYTTEECGQWRAWPSDPCIRFTYFAKKYSNGDIWDPTTGWR